MAGLFDPITVKSMSLKNRVVYPPIATNYGLRNDRAREYYAERARGGAGLVILQGTPVDPFASEKWVNGLKPLVDAIHSQGAAIGIQLWTGNELPNGDQVAPSPIEGHREVTAAELEELIGRFAVAAKAARDIGFDTIDLHGAHGYFLHQLYSPLTNQRDDEYGGSLEKRMTFGVRCTKAVREAVGPDYPVMYRVSAVETTPGGIALEDSIAYAKELVKAGVDVVDVSAGSRNETPAISIPDADAPMGTHADLAAAIKDGAGVPVVAVGRFNTREICEEVLNQGKADLIAVGRQLLADPYWPNKLQEGREDDVVECDSCNALCTGNQRKGEPIACVVNDELGQEYLRYQKK
jgi:2,4-dienoyl-CoA reductase-like NADH-dependent reductase (Old Yellow Enzyme family)